MSRRPLPSLGGVFVGVSLAILLIPCGGVLLLRLYESVLVRRTEARLVAQGAVVAATFRRDLREERQRARLPAIEPALPVVETGAGEDDAEGTGFHPVPPRLDLRRDRVRPRPVDARSVPRQADPVAAAAGRRLSDVLVHAQQTTLAGIRVVDQSGIVVASSRGELGLSLAHREEVGRALRGEHVSLLRERALDAERPPLDSISRNSDLRVFVAVPVVDEDRVRGAVVLSRTPASVVQSLYGIRWTATGFAAATVALAACVALGTALLVTRPVRELLRRIRRLAAGDRAAATPLRHPGTREVDELSRAFASMATALQGRSDTIQAFASHVSHELKAPLTGMRGAVELLRDHLDEMTEAERDRFLAQVDADAERLEDLVRRLLELARADAARPTGERCELAGVLGAVARRHVERGARVVVEADPSVPAVAAAEEVVDSIVGQLVDNARRHGGPDVTIRVRAAEMAPGRVRLEVVDDGPGLTEDVTRRAFDPFFSTARDAGGTGLGLPIVRSLAAAHGGSVGVSSEPGRTTFSVELPS